MAVTENFKIHYVLSYSTTKNGICVPDNITKERNYLGICCHLDKFIISPMWSVESMIFCNSSVMSGSSSLHMPPSEELLNGCEIWCPLRPGTWNKRTNPSIRVMANLVLWYSLGDMWQIQYQLNCQCYIYKYYTTVMGAQGSSVTRGGSKHQAGSQELLLYSTVQYIPTLRCLLWCNSW